MVWDISKLNIDSLGNFFSSGNIYQILLNIWNIKIVRIILITIGILLIIFAIIIVIKVIYDELVNRE